MLLDSELDADDKELVMLINKSAEKMTAMLDHIRDFTRTQRGEKIAVQPEEILLEEIIREVCKAQHIIAPEKEIVQQVHLRGPVQADKKRITQVLNSLLANAMLYGHPNKPVHVHASNENTELEISVQNGADKMSKEILKQIFDPYVRYHSSAEGLGLGLHMAREIISSHNGTISAAYKNGNVIFTVKIPQ